MTSESRREVLKRLTAGGIVAMFALVAGVAIFGQTHASTVPPVAAACIGEGFKTRDELVALLRSLPPDLLQVVAYIGDDGDFHALTEGDLR